MLSNISTIASGILVAFFLPKMMSVESYGFYKTFTLYASYLGLFSLGIIDGIVLEHGNKNYEELNREKFRAYFKWYCIIHLFFATAICASIFFIEKKESHFILLALAIYMLSGNITGYFQQISQITMRFKEFSIRKILQSFFNVVSIILLFVLFGFESNISYRYYLGLWLFISIALTLWYIYTYRDIVFSKSLCLRETYCDIRHLIFTGFPLLFSNLCSTLVLTLDRQFVNVLFNTTTYAMYAFAYNMLTLVTVVTTAISTVLYPVLKRTSNDNLKENYDLLVGALLCFIFAALTLFFPLSLFIKSFLPRYIDSIIFFQIIFPGLVISSTITVIMHNYYKVFDDNLLYFKKSLVILAVSCITNYLAYKISRTPISLSVASIVTMLFWYLYVEQYFVKKCNYKRSKNLFFIIFCTIIFYTTSFIFDEVLGCLAYGFCFILLTILFYRNTMPKIKLLLTKT